MSREILVISIFCAVLLGCILSGVSIVVALLAGLAIFITYAGTKGFRPREIMDMCLSGVRVSSTILITFLFIGMLTASWRASGCIPAIVSYTSGLISPGVIVLATFLLNALVSVLTGTAFGTAATMGVICMSIATSMNIPPFWIGGAILSGVFFGDRCSPVSTSALLVSTLTSTDIYSNIRAMVRSAVVPFALSCLIYLMVGMNISRSGDMLDVSGMFRTEFSITPWCLIPAALILVLACFRVKVKTTMLVSIIAAVIIALTHQPMDASALFKALIFGYEPISPDLKSIISGGGIVSMLRAAAIVCISSCYSGIFEKTGLLNALRAPIGSISSAFGNFTAMLLTSIPVVAISCNQTLAIMLTHQLTSHLTLSDSRRALNLENSAVVVAPLIPWSIAGAVPLSSVGAPMLCILGACYLFLLPMWTAINDFKHK